MQAIPVAEPDPCWPQTFAVLDGSVASALALASVGDTAVLELPGIIDLDRGTPSRGERPAVRVAIAQLGDPPQQLPADASDGAGRSALLVQVLTGVVSQASLLQIRAADRPRGSRP